MICNFCKKELDDGEFFSLIKLEMPEFKRNGNT